jgi:hypothetical protein
MFVSGLFFGTVVVQCSFVLSSPYSDYPDCFKGSMYRIGKEVCNLGGVMLTSSKGARVYMGCALLVVVRCEARISC